ncbi:uncharacterized protein PHALS_01368, partial [Plasmopara halstedii]
MRDPGYGYGGAGAEMRVPDYDFGGARAEGAWPNGPGYGYGVHGVLYSSRNNHRGPNAGVTTEANVVEGTANPNDGGSATAATTGKTISTLGSQDGSTPSSNSTAPSTNTDTPIKSVSDDGTATQQKGYRLLRSDNSER